MGRSLTKPGLPILDAFWGGWIDPATGAPPLDKTPAWVDIVTLAFTGPADNDTYTTAYLCSRYPEETIIGWSRTLQKRGQNILLSVYDNPEHHWADIDIPRFVANAVPVIRDVWGADGIDIDGESGNASAANMIELIQEFRRQLGPDAIITYDTFAYSQWDQEILNAAGTELDWINLMAYFLNEASMQALFANYATLMPADKIAIGVKPGKGPYDQHTPLDEVGALARWNPAGHCKKGMMLYLLNCDIPHFTDEPEFSWIDAMHTNMAPCDSSQHVSASGGA